MEVVLGQGVEWRWGSCHDGWQIEKDQRIKEFDGFFMPFGASW